MEVADRLKAIPPYVFAEIGKKARALAQTGVDVINLGIGAPDQPTPRHVVDAMHEAIEKPANHQYPPFGGTPQFKEAAAQWANKRFGINIEAETEVTTLIGCKEGLHHLLLAYIGTGDIALIPDPAYPVYKTSTELAGGTPHFMPLLPENNYLPDLDAIPDSVAQKAKILLINYPNNPTAGIADMAFFEKVVAFCKKHDILLCHDNAYSEMTYDGYKAPSILQVKGAKDIAIELHTMSKTYNMAGWRLGFAIGNKTAIANLAKIKSNVDTDVFSAIQVAGIAGLNGPRDHIDHCNKLYEERRDLAVIELKKLGWEVEPVKATFYMWLPTPKGMGSEEFSTLMLNTAGIVVPPGNAYGPGGEGYFRISLCVSKERLQEAFDRMAKHSITYDMLSAAKV
ncbi:MAG: LL-diaminopimelate aminotransferase [Planctomycetota bacterium]|nr:LL-diaminopimelate aminotransferase [Planctomycetota bacterium]MDZ4836883.1 LL-diaminopimelate aminotransferase [Candidatus Melainabacteria bacterium]